MEEQLQKVMSNCGVASRRASGKDDIRRARPRQRHRPRTGTKVSPDRTALPSTARPLEAQPKHYYLFNKPKGVITTSSDDRGRATVMDYFRKEKDRIYAVRLLDRIRKAC